MVKKIGIIVLMCGVLCVLFGISNLAFGNINFFDDSSDKVVNKRLDSTDYRLFYSDIQMTISYFDLYISKFDNFKMGELSNKEKTKFVLSIITDYRSPEATEEDVVSESKKYFSDFDLYKKSIASDSNNVLFQYQDGKFTYLSSDKKDYIASSEVISNEGYSDSWVTKKKIYFMKTSYSNGLYQNMVYKNEKDFKNNKELYSFVTDTPAVQVDDYQRIQEQLPTYVYTFKRKKNQYFLDTVKMED